MGFNKLLVSFSLSVFQLVTKKTEKCKESYLFSFMILRDGETLLPS